MLNLNKQRSQRSGRAAPHFLPVVLCTCTPHDESGTNKVCTCQFHEVERIRLLPSAKEAGAVSSACAQHEVDTRRRRECTAQHPFGNPENAGGQKRPAEQPAAGSSGQGKTHFGFSFAKTVDKAANIGGGSNGLAIPRKGKAVLLATFLFQLEWRGQKHIKKEGCFTACLTRPLSERGGCLAEAENT